MLLSEIVKYVNAKSFGETSYTYDDIYPYFQEAINSLNVELDSHRRIPDAPVITEDIASYNNTAYTAISDMHISNYIVTYIVVAMDNASLSITSRTQTYASQLSQYKQRLISELYKFMPITSSPNVYFDFTGGASNRNVPNVKIIYDEKIGGALSCNGDVVPTYGIVADNPYGTIEPADSTVKIKKGVNLYDYIFTPSSHFRQFYSSVKVPVAITGYDIEYTP